MTASQAFISLVCAFMCPAHALQVSQNGSHASLIHDSGPHRSNNAIIIPSWSGHLDKVKTLLQSFHEYCEDRSSFTIYVIVASDEEKEFQPITALAPESDVQIITLQSLLPEAVDETALLQQIGKVSFQGMKKFMALVQLPFKTVLLLDSESCFVRPIQLEDTMAMAAREIVFDPNVEGMNGFQVQALEMANKFLHTHSTAWPGMALHYQWIMDKSVIEGMVAELPSDPRQAIFEFFQENKDVFPEIIYYTYALQNKDTLRMSVYDIRFNLQNAYFAAGVSKKHDFSKKMRTHYLEHYWDFMQDDEDVLAMKHLFEDGLLGHPFTWTMQNSGHAEPSVKVICEVSTIKLITSTDMMWLGKERHLVNFCPQDKGTQIVGEVS